MNETKEAVFEAAFHAYKSGRYQNAVNLLEGVDASAFERGRRATLNCNILACKMENLKNTSQIAGVLEELREAWKRIKGLQPCTVNMPEELATCCNACQTIYCLWQGGDTTYMKEGIDFSKEAIARACLCYSVSTAGEDVACTLVQLATKLSHSEGDEEVPNSAPPFVLQCLLKLALLCAMFLSYEGCDVEASTITRSIECILSCSGDPEEVEIDSNSSMLKVYLLVEKYVHTNYSEDSHDYEPLEAYLEAWHAYQCSRYQEALCALQRVCNCTHAPLVAMGRLLAGCCYMRQNKLQLALCSFQGCLQTTACMLPALHNCVQVFRLLGNEEAEFGFRQLLVEALEKSKDPERWGRGDWRACPSQSLSVHLLQFQYSSVIRALECKRYRTASQLIQNMISVMKTGNVTFPQHLPSTTKLHLLLAHSLLSCGEYTECQVVADRVISAMNPTIAVMDVDHITSENVLQGFPVPWPDHAVTLLRTLFIKGCALQYNKNPGGAQRCYQQVLKIINVLLPHLLRSVTHGRTYTALQQTEDLKVSVLNNLAVVAVTMSEHSQSFALIVQALACPRGVSETTVVNYVRLLLRQGKKGDAYTSWLQYRGKLPASGNDATDVLKAIQSFTKPSEEQQLDIEALNFWIYHKRTTT